jgi:broad specificity phosphatase PhoE
MTLLITRHGETDYNRKRICQGSKINAPLNFTGRKQVKQGATALLSEFNKIDYFISSPLSRAIETASIISSAYNYKKSIVLDERILERSYGDFEGEPSQYFIDLQQSGADISMYYESDESLLSRVNSFIKDLIIYSKDDVICITTHSQVVKAFYALATKDNLAFHSTFFNNAATMILDYNGSKLEYKKIVDSNPSTIKFHYAKELGSR